MAGNPNWVKGVSGNPGGRAKESDELKRLIRDKTQNGSTIVAKMLEWIDCEDSHLQIAAVKYLLEYGFGKPKESVELSGSVTLGDLYSAMRESRLRKVE
jgi:hypothetical protein